MSEQIIVVLAASAASGFLSYAGTLAALKVHISYINKRLDRHDDLIAELQAGKR